MNKKQKIVLTMFCSLFALILIGALIGTAALLLSGNAHGLVGELPTGWVKELRENWELVQIEKEWESIIQKENSDIAKIVIISGEHQMPYSSTLKPMRAVTIDDEEQIDSVINILSEHDVTWEQMPKGREENKAFINSRIGKQMITFYFFDSNDGIFMKLDVYEDNVCTISSDLEITSQTSMTWHRSCRVNFTNEVFSSLDELCKDFE